MNVNILATCRNPELLPATLLVFKTLRTGFPNAHVTVCFNHLNPPGIDEHIRVACKDAGVQAFAKADGPVFHHDYIYLLIGCGTEPFILCDTDIVFWKSCEDWNFEGVALAGRYIPQFMDKFTQCITRPRLHTSLLYVNPSEARTRLGAYARQFPDTQFADKPFNPLADLIRQTIIPNREGRIIRNYFYDTCSMLYQAIGGSRFNELHLECYDHLHAGTVSDLVAPCYPDEQLQVAHFAIFENPNLAKGLWKSQDEFYKKHAV